jgi:hypothetical protein
MPEYPPPPLLPPARPRAMCERIVLLAPSLPLVGRYPGMSSSHSFRDVVSGCSCVQSTIPASTRLTARLWRHLRRPKLHVLPSLQGILHLTRSMGRDMGCVHRRKGTFRARAVRAQGSQANDTFLQTIHYPRQLCSDLGHLASTLRAVR